MATPSEVLRKMKPADKKADKEDDNDKDDKAPKRNALIDFIAKHKSKK